MSVSEALEIRYPQRLEALRLTKLRQTQEKQVLLGAMDYDDWGIILPPSGVRQVTKAVSGSGVEITDVLLKGVTFESNHASGAWYGPELCGRNYRALLEAHPVYVDPQSSLAGAYMVNFSAYRSSGWPEELHYPRAAELALYKQSSNIGTQHHMCQDLAVGLELG
jgi:hypothetical protein